MEASAGRGGAIKIALRDLQRRCKSDARRQAGSSERLGTGRVKRSIPNGKLRQARERESRGIRMHPDADGLRQARWQAVVISRLDLDARVTWLAARRMAVGRPRANGRAKIAPEQPVVASPRLASPRLASPCLARAKRGGEDAVAAAPLMLPRPATDSRRRLRRGTRRQSARCRYR